jgi:hypothetical protein
MDLASYINSLRDPAGVPFYPFVFQFLMVLTFALHIIFVNFALGGSAIAIWGKFNGNPHALRLSKALARATTTNISIAITFGVAPLLFVQVIYDPFWYTANTMSAWWTLGFLALVTMAFIFTYVGYLTGKSNEKGGNIFWIIMALVSILLAALTMHGLSEEQLHPDKWKEWLTQTGTLKTSGDALYAILIPRLTHFIVPSFAITGIYLMLYSWLFRERKDFSTEYLDYVLNLGVKIAFYATIFQVAAGFWWLLSLPSHLNFIVNHAFLFGAFLGMALLVMLAMAQADPKKYIFPSAILGFVTVFFMSYARETLRMAYFKGVNYTIFDYRVAVDWGSAILFFGTFIMGIIVVAFPAIVAFNLARKGQQN